MKILVTGGAGYIGSHMVRLLGSLGYEVDTFDDLSTGFCDAVLEGRLIEGSLLDQGLLQKIFQESFYDLVIHFAGSISVGESVQNPAKYYRNNLVASLNLVDAMVRNKVNKLVFSSTAAIFGNPQYTPIDERHPQLPINPYGQTKLYFEKVLLDYEKSYGLNSVSLRYFNASGADPDGRLGERHAPETHLIPLAIRASDPAMPELTVFGNDYATRDGTCIRDYIHVDDLCEAHLLAIRHLLEDGKSRQYNLGNGEGYSVLDVIWTVEKVTGRKVRVSYGPRRQGDPMSLVADSSNIRKDWGWCPRYGLEEIVRHAWRWECKP